MNASDGKHTASTKVQVTVKDANDNAPEFIDIPYRIENKVVEEDKSVITNPKLLLTVSLCVCQCLCAFVYNLGLFTRTNLP